MPWDDNGSVTGGRRPHDGWLAQFLRKEAEQQAAMLVAIRERVQRDLERNPDVVPGKETMRAARFAQEGYKILAGLELETAKVKLLAQRVHGKTPMSDDEYAKELEALGRDALDSLSDADLALELERRRTALPAPRPAADREP